MPAPGSPSKSSISRSPSKRDVRVSIEIDDVGGRAPDDAEDVSPTHTVRTAHTGTSAGNTMMTDDIMAAVSFSVFPDDGLAPSMPTKTFSGLGWPALQTFATGCSNDYFSRQSGSVRIEFPDGVASTFDPVNVMKDGIMLLSYDHVEAVFERRLLKVDHQLRFLNLLDITPKTKSFQQTSMVSVPLSHVKHIYTLDDAIRIVEEQAISCDSLRIDSTFVMWVDACSKEDAGVPDLDEEMPPVEKLFIFVAAPQQKLRECIQACKDFSDGSATGVGGPSMIRVDQVVLQDVEELLARDSPDFKFDVAFRNISSMRTVTIFADTCDKADLGGLKEKLESEFFPIDMARLNFVLQDAISLRRAIVGMATEMFKRGITRFITDWEQMQMAVPDSMNLPGALEESGILFRMLNVNGNDDAMCKYNEASTRSAVGALKHLFHLEREFAILTETPEQIEEIEEEQIAETQAKASTGDVVDARWRCPDCRFINSATTPACEVCGTEAPASVLGGMSPAPSQSPGQGESPGEVPDTCRGSPRAKVKAKPLLGAAGERQPILTALDPEATAAEERASLTDPSALAPPAGAGRMQPTCGKRDGKCNQQ